MVLGWCILATFGLHFEATSVSTVPLSLITMRTQRPQATAMGALSAAVAVSTSLSQFTRLDQTTGLTRDLFSGRFGKIHLS